MAQHPHLIHPVQPVKIQTPRNGFEPLRGMEELWSTPGKEKMVQKKRNPQGDDRQSFNHSL